LIASITGKVLEIDPTGIVVEANGLGYKLFATSHTLFRATVGSTISLAVKQIFRENEVSLYGFASGPERRLFELLISTNGLGPKLALALLEDVGEQSVVRAISENDVKTLTRASGVGQKLAQKICLDLADKIREESLLGKLATPAESGLGTVIQALVTLGVRRMDAERAAAKAKEETGDTDPQRLIPIALKYASSN
jgi:Holliday junction DNA helicase RuvA